MKLNYCFLFSSVWFVSCRLSIGHQLCYLSLKPSGRRDITANKRVLASLVLANCCLLTVEKRYSVCMDKQYYSHFHKTYLPYIRTIQLHFVSNTISQDLITEKLFQMF